MCVVSFAASVPPTLVAELGSDPLPLVSPDSVGNQWLVSLEAQSLPTRNCQRGMDPGNPFQTTDCSVTGTGWL